MVFLVIIVLLILFILSDLAIRYLIKHYKTKKQRLTREEILQSSLSYDFTSEAKSLKRVEIENSKAKILCVDDESIILDSFRKILVLDGYSIDTVENGKEALGLVQKNHYDFVFTDLKMPEMSGEEVTKAVKHIRPDIDVVIITGFATVESAVECMQYGAMDYLQKPFTEEELLSKVKEFLIKRKENIKSSLKPQVNITHFDDSTSSEDSDFSIPGGVFISRAHVWLNIDQSGKVKVGIDDFAKKIIGKVNGIDSPNLGMEISVGQTIFSIKQDNKRISFPSPISGKVLKTNKELSKSPELLDESPYASNWVCELDCNNLDEELKNLKIGKTAVNYYRDQIDELNFVIKGLTKSNGNSYAYLSLLEKVDQSDFTKLSDKFFNKI
jgi:CheY-like chemotaxis protein/glycine cleavage system H lipoate-binding protein